MARPKKRQSDAVFAQRLAVADREILAALRKAMVEAGCGRALEFGLHDQLSCERVQSEWFRGPLANAVISALLDAAPAQEAQAAE